MYSMLGRFQLARPRLVMMIFIGLMFVLNAQAQFLEQQQFINMGDRFSTSGDFLVFGDPNSDEIDFNAGIAFVYERQDNGTWQLLTKLIPSDAALDDRFGNSVSIDGERIIIGASNNDDDGRDSGSAYIFERQGDGSWQQVAKLTAADAAAKQEFGQFVSLSGSRAAIVSLGENPLREPQGAVYVFERQGDGSWQQVVKLIWL